MPEQNEPEMSLPEAEVKTPAASPYRSAPPTPAPPPRGNGRMFRGVMFGCLALIGIAVLIAIGGAFANREGTWAPGEKVAVLSIEGEITDSRDAIETLHQYRDNSSIRAIVVRINSPGGGVVPSQEIFEEIQKIRHETRKPVVASLDSVAASGGYYIAAACDRIVANPGTITGSIGVIAQWMNIGDLLRWARVQPETITSGTMKDVGSPYREMTPAERGYMQQITNDLHGQFISAVAKGRQGKLTRAEVTTLADGRVYTGEQARRLKLVDEIGNLHDAAESAAKLAGMSGEPRLLYPRPRRPRLIDLVAEGKITDRLLGHLSSRSSLFFLYRWQ